MIWLIGAGGAVGAAARYLLGEFIRKRGKGDFPLATWLINISGSFMLGVLAGLHTSNSLVEWMWSFLGIGFCGAYTTFSTFGIETITLIEKKKYRLAIVYVISSVLTGVLSAAYGYFLALNINS